MTKQDLIDICQEKIDDLNGNLEEPPVEYSFYNDFMHDYSVKNLSGLLKIPYVDLVSALIYPDMDSDTLGEVVEATNSFKYVLNVLTDDELDAVNQMFLSFIRNGDGDILAYIFDYSNPTLICEKVKRIFSMDGSNKEDKEYLLEIHKLIDKLLKNNKKPGWNIPKLVEYYRKSSAGMHNIIAVVRFLKHIKEDNIDYNSKEFKAKHGKTEKDILTVCNAIDMCRKMINEDYKKYKASISHELTIYKKFKRDIESSFEKDEIINYEMIIHDIDDEKLRREFLYLVYKHNMNEYDKVDSLNKSLKENSVTNYISILKNYSIKKDEVDLNKVMRNSCGDLDKMLKILNGIVGDKDTIIRIIEFSDLMNVNYFKELKSNGVLGNSAFIRYPSVFNIGSAERELLDKNIKTVENYNIDFSLFNKAPDVLIENDKLDNNLNILYNYKLLDKMSNTKKFKFLKNDNLIEIIDKVIELGYEDFLDEGLDLLNENNWDRIYVLKSMGLKPEKKADLLKYLRDDKFFISNNQLNSYIEDVSKYYDDLVTSSDYDIERIVSDNSISDRSLNFNGVIISKNRVARNLECEEFDINDFFKAIIKGSILNTEEVETIKKTLKNKVYRIVE